MEQQFSLSWNNFHGNLSKGFAGLLGKGEFVDVTLAVEGHLLQAHKVVLSICSPYFKKMFQSNPCQHPIVVLRDVTHKAMQDLLQFMYHGEVSVKQEDLTGFISVADVLQIKGLTNKETDEESEESIPKSNISPAVNHANPNTRRSVDNIDTIYADELSRNQQIDLLHQRQILDKLNKLSALKRKSEEYIQHNFCTNIQTINENYNLGEKRLKLREKHILNMHKIRSESQTHDESANVSASYDEALRLNSQQPNENHSSSDNEKLDNTSLENGLMNIKSECEDNDIIVTDPAALNNISGTSDNNNIVEENHLQHELLSSPGMQEGALSLVMSHHHQQLPDRYKYIYSRKGHKQLVHQNFVYTKHSTSHGKTSWRCVQYFSLNRCPATVETVGSMIYAVNHHHNHEDCLDKIINSCVYEMTFGNKE